MKVALTFWKQQMEFIADVCEGGSACQFEPKNMPALFLIIADEVQVITWHANTGYERWASESDNGS